MLRKLILGSMPFALDDPDDADDADQLHRILLIVFGSTTIGNLQHHGATRVASIANTLWMTWHLVMRGNEL